MIFQDSDSDHHSDSESENTDGSELLEDESDDDSEGNWSELSSEEMEFKKPEEESGLTPEQDALLDKIRKNKVRQVVRYINELLFKRFT